MDTDRSAQAAHSGPITGRKKSPVAVNRSAACHSAENRSNPPRANTHHSTASATTTSEAWCTVVASHTGSGATSMGMPWIAPMIRLYAATPNSIFQGMDVGFSP